jgi:hypothetical protein
VFQRCIYQQTGSHYKHIFRTPSPKFTNFIIIRFWEGGGSCDQRIAFTPHRTELCEASTSTFEIIQKYPDQVGLFVQSCDFSNLHPASVFTEEEQEVLRQYGAIFDEQDEANWAWTLHKLSEKSQE